MTAEAIRDSETPARPPRDPERRKTCYVRPVLVGDVRDEIARESQDELRLRDDNVLYALHAADGSRIALMSDRAIAFAAARQHEMTPVSVH